MDGESEISLITGISRRKKYSARRILFLLLGVVLVLSASVYFSSELYSRAFGKHELKVGHGETDLSEEAVGAKPNLERFVKSSLKSLKRHAAKAEATNDNPVSNFFKRGMGLERKSKKESPVGGMSMSDLFKQGQALYKIERSSGEEAVAESEDESRLSQEIQDEEQALAQTKSIEVFSPPVPPTGTLEKDHSIQGKLQRIAADLADAKKNLREVKSERAVAQVAEEIKLKRSDPGPGSGTLEKDDSLEAKLDAIGKSLKSEKQSLSDVDEADETPNGDTIYLVHDGNVNVAPATTMVPMMMVPVTQPPCNQTVPVPTDPCTGNATVTEPPVEPVIYCEPCQCNPLQCGDGAGAGPTTTDSAMNITDKPKPESTNTTTTKGPGGCVCPKTASKEDQRYFYVTDAPRDQPPVHHFIVHGDHDINHIHGAISHILASQPLDEDDDPNFESDGQPTQIIHIAGKRGHVAAHMQEIGKDGNAKHSLVYKIKPANPQKASPPQPAPRPHGNPHMIVLQTAEDQGNDDEEEEPEEEDQGPEEMPPPTYRVHKVHHLIHHDGNAYLASHEDENENDERRLVVTHQLSHQSENMYSADPVDSDDGPSLIRVHHILPHEGQAGFLAKQTAAFDPDQEKQGFTVTHHLIHRGDAGEGAFQANPIVHIQHQMTVHPRTSIHHVIHIPVQPKPTPPPPPPPVRIDHFIEQPPPPPARPARRKRRQQPEGPGFSEPDVIHQFIPGEDEGMITHLRYRVPEVDHDSDLHADLHEVLGDVQDGIRPPPRVIVHTNEGGMEYNDAEGDFTPIHAVHAALAFHAAGPGGPEGPIMVKHVVPQESVASPNRRMDPPDAYEMGEQADYRPIYEAHAEAETAVAGVANNNGVIFDVPFGIH